MSSPEQLAAAPQLDAEAYQEILTAGFRSAMRVHGDYHSAQDAAQEGALATWQAGQKETIESAAAYGAVVARRRALDQKRHMSRTFVDSEAAENIFEQRAQPDDFGLMDTYEAIQQILAVVDNDSGATKMRSAVLRLAAIEFSTVEIAETLGITASNAKSLLHRGRKALKKRGEEFGLMDSPEQLDFTAQPIGDELYREIFSAGHRIAMRLHGDYHLAEEAASDGALMLWQESQKEHIRNPRTFAITSTRVAALSQLRRLKRTYIDSETVETMLDSGSHEDPYDTFDTYSAVMQVVETLKGRRANETRPKIFQLMAAEFRPREIAEVLGLPPEYVQNQVAVGRQMLKGKREAFGL